MPFASVPRLRRLLVSLPTFRLRIPIPTRKNRAHCHPSLPKLGKLGTLAVGAPVASGWLNNCAPVA